MQVTYKVEGEPLEQLPDAYSEHYVQVGFWRDYTQGYDKRKHSLMRMLMLPEKSILWIVQL